ncbi:Dymeclin superfamily domain-containing protein [Histoplasma capsulatum var. duboisii H88]|uniref:Dymeclin superfamily domain-containing protein n=1 Tax=Ajellomyces capsulatus (strain H88) TaxID=544711 RepID=A0A8A1LH80_AJEC8|nr:Dymeclin superfamily domain-containing protein [Histoplasma capsulatum var. duboisii H88]
MGGSESKLAFRQGIFRLSEESNIAADDPYWTGFWELPESPEDVFSLFSPADIRRTRDASIANLETLILAVTSRLIVLKNHPSFPDPDLAPDRDALNCIRVLTRILPFIYESENLEAWEEKFFWGRRRKKHRHAQIASQVLFDGASEDDEMRRSNPQNHQNDYYDAKPLAEELIDTLVDLLFYSGFTIPTIPNAKGKVSYSIWQSGVGCTTAMGSNKELESNRCEILRLLLTLSSQSMYMPLSLLPVKGVKTITYLVTCPDKQVVLSLLCSLLNTTIKYNPTPWRLPYDHVVWKDPKQIFVIYCLQFLLVLLLYPIPEDGRGSPPKNFYRHFYGRLHRPQDFQFIVEGMTRILNQPMQATTSYLPGSHKSVKWAPEMIMLFWEALQCNKRFRSYMIDSSRALDFVVLCIFYAIEYKTDASKLGVVKMCIFILQTLSVEPNFGKNLNKKFESQDTLPQSIRLQNFRGSYADFLIISIHTLLTTSKGKLDAVYPALLAIINNISAYCEHLSATTCSKIIQLFSLLSSPSFLLANESNHILLHSLLEFFNSVLEHQYSNNPLLVYSILKSAKRFESLRAFTLESGQEEIERLNQRRKANQVSSNSDALLSPTISHSGDDNRGSGAGRRQLSHVPEDGAFAIGDDDSDEEEQEPQNTPSQSPSRENSRAPSVASAADESVPLQLRGMSEKARGKMPAGQVTFSRQNSTTSLSSYTPTIPTNSGGFAPTSSWIESWVPELPLHTIITLISAITPHIPSSALQSTLNPDARTFISNLPSFAEEPRVHALIAEPSPIRVHLFEWSPLSLGWYESLLWGFIFASEMLVGSASGSTPGAVGVWNGTAIKLFKVQETAAQGPTLLAPKGAVDAVGSNLVQRIGNLNLRGRGSGSQEGQGEAGRDA